MTLHELLTENNIHLSMKQRKHLGRNICTSYKARTGKSPEKIASVEPEVKNEVNDYPEDWLLDKGVTIVLRYMNKQAKKH